MILASATGALLTKCWTLSRFVLWAAALAVCHHVLWLLCRPGLCAPSPLVRHCSNCCRAVAHLRRGDCRHLAERLHVFLGQLTRLADLNGSCQRQLELIWNDVSPSIGPAQEEGLFLVIADFLHICEVDTQIIPFLFTHRAQPSLSELHRQLFLEWLKHRWGGGA